MHRRSLLLAAAALPVVRTAAYAQGNAGGTVNVLYAGSLVNLMEHGVGPAFVKAGQGRFRGYAGGSNKLANEIKGKLRRADVFISANPKVNDDLMGTANDDWVSWYVVFAQSPLVIGYNPLSRFVGDLKSKPWYQVLQEPGIRIGRTDPKLDPKGKLTIDLLDKAAQVTHQPGLTQKVLGAPENPAQVFPEENLIGRLQSGQLDVAFFYSTETADRRIDAITPPPEMTLSAHYTATVPRDAANPAGAERFVSFLLSAGGQALMRQHGLDVVKPSVAGDASKVPASLHQALSAAG
ncbi:extracellular solute-binding protein [Rhodopila sp.]|uniref:extracellular solute-binding protein n=1 Tax=Rhodopila sp. TaxID=2480087 RepID=UPI003D0C4907